MNRNTTISSTNKINSSPINSINIHDTPASIKYKYLKLLKNTILESHKKSVGANKISSQDDVTDDNAR